MDLIADHHQNQNLNSQWLSHQLHLSSISVESAFMHCRGRSCAMAIQAYRLSRLFEGITCQPSLPLTLQVANCGFHSLEISDREFAAEFGIDLVQFHQVSQRAAEDRQFRQTHPERQALIINE